VSSTPRQGKTLLFDEIARSSACDLVEQHRARTHSAKGCSMCGGGSPIRGTPYSNGTLNTRFFEHVFFFLEDLRFAAVAWTLGPLPAFPQPTIWHLTVRASSSSGSLCW
jgi:hypothetical protein